MRVLVNGLSVSTMSGEHVLTGLLNQLAKWTNGDHEYVLLGKNSNGHYLSSILSHQNIVFLTAPGLVRNLVKRSLWEISVLPKLLEQKGVDLYFTPSGASLPMSTIPQVCLAQNPWPMIQSVHCSIKDKTKAGLQRMIYRRTVRKADLMIYNSNYMRSLYHSNNGRSDHGENVVAYLGVHDSAFAASEALRHTLDRRPLSILTVSSMAPWKGIETVVRAIHSLRARGVRASLDLVGPWPNYKYLQVIRRLIRELDLEGTVQIVGKVCRDRLYEYYATAQVFCLMSHSESFSIPSAEAQVFGTPVVGSSRCAIEEIAGSGGVFGPPDDPENTADLLQSLLDDSSYWHELSARGFQECSKVPVEDIRPANAQDV